MHGLIDIIDVIKGHNKFKTHKVQLSDLLQARSLHNKKRTYLCTLKYRSMNGVLLLTRYRSGTCSSKNNITNMTDYDYKVTRETTQLSQMHMKSSIIVPLKQISWLVR